MASGNTSAAAVGGTAATAATVTVTCTVPIQISFINATDKTLVTEDIYPPGSSITVLGNSIVTGMGQIVFPPDNITVIDDGGAVSTGDVGARFAFFVAGGESATVKID